MDHSENPVLIRRDGPVLAITLNRPGKLNAINGEMFAALAEAAEKAARDETVRVVTFAGEGRAFCAGGDIGGMRKQAEDGIGAEDLEHAFRRLQNIYELIESISVPTIAAIHGHCLGAGLQIALMCDFRIAALESTLGLPDVRNGIIPGLGATIRLPRLIGMAQTLDLILTGDPIDAEKAERIGLVNCVVPGAKLNETVQELTRKLLDRAPLALAAAKSLLRADAHWDEIASTQAGLMASRDAKEGRLAFFQKRRPQFKGR